MGVVSNNLRITDPLNVLIIGNNPIELSTICEQLGKLRSTRITAETAFDLKSALKSKTKFKPSFILIDDNIGKNSLKELMENLTRQNDTRDIPITILKNSNYQESAEGAQEYILKHNANGEAIAKALLNSVNIKKATYVAEKIK